MGGDQRPAGGGSSISTAHGSAAWLTPDEAAAFGLYEPAGLLFGRGSRGLLRYPVRRGKHALVVAPSRSGKGIGFVIPNLLTWTGSVFAIDPKGELAHFTAERRRKMGQRVFVLDPCRVSGQAPACFNPLLWLRDSHNLDGDLNIIIEALMPESGGASEFWNNSARRLLRGIILYQIANPNERRSLARTYEIFNASDVEWGKVLKTMRKGSGRYGPLNMRVKEEAHWFDSLHEEHQQYHRGTVQFHLDWIGMDAARAMIETSDFDMRDIKGGGVTVYVCIPPLNTSSYAGFTRLLSTLAIKAIMAGLESTSSKRLPALLMLDEFATTVGRLKVFDDAFTNIAGYGGRFAIILQTIDQLQSLYPERHGNQSWRTIYENCGLRLFFDAQHETAKFVSDALGEMTVNHLAPIGGARQTSRKLLFPNEVAAPMDANGQRVDDAAFAFVEGLKPVAARRIVSYRDKEFSSLYAPNSPYPENGSLKSKTVWQLSDHADKFAKTIGDEAPTWTKTNFKVVPPSDEINKRNRLDGFDQ